MSLLARLFVLIAAVAIPAIAAQLYAAREFAAERERQGHAVALSWANFAAGELDLIIEGARGILVTLAASPSIRSGRRDLCEQYLESLREAHPRFLGLIVVDADGRPTCASNIRTVPADVTGREYFESALASEDFIVGSFTRSRANSTPLLPLALRFTDDDGKVAGVIVAPLLLDELNNVFDSKPLPAGTSFSMIDRDGTLLLRVPQRELTGAKISAPRAWLTHQQKSGTFETAARETSDGRPRIAGYVPLKRGPLDVIVLAGVLSDVAYEGFPDAARTALLASAGAMALALLLAWIGVRRYIGGPIRSLNAAAARWTAGDAAARAEVHVEGDEIGRLATAFNAMAAANEARVHERDQVIGQLRTLVGELNHRTKNSLAAVHAMMRQTARARPTLDEFLPAFERRLLAYLKAHELLHESNWKTTGLRPLAEAVVAPYVDDRLERFEMVGVDAALQPQTALALALALGELATNAAKYGAFSTENGRVRLDCERNAAGRLVLTWTEIGGPSVSQPERSGFGSRLLQQLASSLQGDLEMRFNRLGVVCEISFPLAA